jgi:hypothetical protein
MVNELEKDRRQLLEELSKLRKSLDWYKRTYEERSLAAIIYERLFKKRNNLLLPGIIKINKTGTLFSGKILCVIANHNYSKNAGLLRNSLLQYYDTLIIDSGSDSPPKDSLQLENVYYTGLLNKAYSIAIENNYQYLLFICSDVLINRKNTRKMFERLSNIDLSKIGVYSASSKGNSYSFCNNQSSGNLREVPFVEGFMFLCDITILDHLCPIDRQKNLYGWGLDIAKSFYAKEKNKLCVIDDMVEVEHLAGTGYSRETAEVEMTSWISSLNNDSLTSFYRNVLNLIKTK